MSNPYQSPPSLHTNVEDVMRTCDIFINEYKQAIKRVPDNERAARLFMLARFTKLRKAISSEEAKQQTDLTHLYTIIDLRIESLDFSNYIPA